jgi:hypothetical protein
VSAAGGRVLDHFRLQAAESVGYGSRFVAELSARFADDLVSNGPVADLVGDWPSNPRADAVAMRLAGALHYAVLSNRDPALAALYPAQCPAWRMEEVWPVARAFLARERDWVQDFIKYPPQTNETRRSVVLLAAFLTFARDWRGPMDMLELGASAGLNLYWDRFRYRTAGWSWGDGASPVLIETDWRGPSPPVDVRPNVCARAACDQNPLDIADPEQRLRLKSYIWADQPERLARFDAAVALALKHGVSVDRADAARWLNARLDARAGDAATVVYHSIFLQYPPRETRAAIVEAMERAGARATEAAPLAWVRFEPEALVDGVRDSLRYVLDLTTWPGGRRRILAYADGHARRVEAIDSQ